MENALEEYMLQYKRMLQYQFLPEMLANKNWRFYEPINGFMC